ncbi:hypothetical protein KFE98_00285 [bacterium SCSIO 12741]|nr:hypothetical protein KFE98_00285 [bacterium SCSIO 12741]
MKKGIAIVIACLFVNLTWAQDFEVPEDYSFSDESEYQEYEDDVLDCIQWMIETPPDVELQKRMDAQTFFLKWVTGTPTITLELSGDGVELASKNSMLLFIYMAGYARYEIENEDTDPKEGNEIGVKTVLDYYKEHEEYLKRDKKIEKLIEE